MFAVTYPLGFYSVITKTSIGDLLLLHHLEGPIIPSLNSYQEVSVFPMDVQLDSLVSFEQLKFYCRQLSQKGPNY